MAHEGWKCGDCGNLNNIRETKCICGNPRPMTVNPGGSSAHGGCTIAGCNMPGVFNDSLRGGGTWYCRYHYRYKGDSQHCARITEELKKNPPKLSGAKASGELVNI